MKKMRKLIAVVLAVTVAMTMGIASTSLAFAANSGDETAFSITIDNAVNGETYTAYKVFDATYSGDKDPAPGAAPAAPAPDNRAFHNAYSYSISSASKWWSVVTGDPNKTTEGGVITSYGLTFTPTTTSGVYNVAATSSFNAAAAAALAEVLDAAKAGKDVAGSAEAKNGTASITVTDAGAGYYFIDTTLGSLCSLDTTEPSATIREKNTIPSEDKEVSDGEAAATSQDATDKKSTTVKIGDTVNFTITVTDSKGTDKAITVHDTMSDGLTLDVGSFEVKKGTATVDASNYTIKVNSANTVPKKGTNTASNYSTGEMADGCTFEIVLKDTYVASLNENEVVTITYSAELNKDAETANPFETNKTHINYSNQSTNEVTTTVKTYEGDVVKTDSNNKILDGATFKLYNAQTGGTEYQLVATSTDGVYVIKSSDNTGAVAQKLTPKDGKLTIKGLENGTYYLEEVDAPQGYNKLTERKALVINNANASATIDGTTYQSGGLQVINNAGTELPSTGGIGTTIFYILGALLVIGCGVILIARRRMSANN